MIAALGMYDMPALKPMHDRFWNAIRARLGYGPEALTRGGDFWDIWQSPELLLAQTCGFPYRARLHGHVALVGTPDYGLPGCPPGHYNSVLVVRKDDPRSDLSQFDGAAFAYNEALSQSGWAAPATHFATHGLLIGPRVKTGAHAASAQAVAEGRADIAAIDALTWTLLRRHGTGTDDLREIDRTAPTPALPYITARARDPEPIFRAVAAAITDLSAADRDALHLEGLIAIPAEAYLAVETPPEP